MPKVHLDDLWSFDPASGAWRRHPLSLVPHARTETHACVVGTAPDQAVCVYGGYYDKDGSGMGSTYFDDVWCLEALPPLPSLPAQEHHHWTTLVGFTGDFLVILVVSWLVWWFLG